MTKDVDYLLVGGGLASAVAAECLRSEGSPMGKIVLISAEKYLPYYRPVLPKNFLLGEVEREKAFIFPEEYYTNNNIETILATQVLSVDPKSNWVNTDRAGDFHFKKLLIATGCSPRPLAITGSTLAGIHYLHSFDDAHAIRHEIGDAKKVVIVGGSYVGIELASSLLQKGIHVTILAQEFSLFNVHPFVDPRRYLEHHGVEVIETAVAQFKGSKRVSTIETSSGKTLPCDFVVVLENYDPAIDFLLDSGIQVDNGILVNKYLETNYADIYAAGDVAQFYDAVFGKYRRIEGSDNAARQGKVAAMNMLGSRTCYRAAAYCFFNAFGDSFVALGDSADADECVMRGSVTEKSFASLYLKNGLLRSAFFCGRPISEIKATESLIVNRINLKPYKKKIIDSAFPLEPLAIQNVLTLQGGGALGAFECGVVKAMEEYGIFPDIVAGISIGAFNSAIIASNPRNAAQALASFWDELSVDTLAVPDEQARRILSSWQAIVWGSPKFFHPRWLMPVDKIDDIPVNWTSFYDASFIKNLLYQYVDFNKLKDSPVRLLLMAVNVETAEFETFDSYTEELTADHILASGSLPPGFPWTTIKNKHYWDGGIVTNSPLDSTFEICGSSGKKVYIVELYPRKRPLPKNMLDVLTRKDEILFSEKIRKGIRERELLGKYRKLVEIILKLSSKETVEEIMQLPIYIQTMGDPGLVSVTRIIREIGQDDPYSWDSDFSRETIIQHKKRGYETAMKTLKVEAPLSA